MINIADNIKIVILIANRFQILSANTQAMVVMDASFKRLA